MGLRITRLRLALLGNVHVCDIPEMFQFLRSAVTITLEVILMLIPNGAIRLDILVHSDRKRTKVPAASISFSCSGGLALATRAERGAAA